MFFSSTTILIAGAIVSWLGLGTAAAAHAIMFKRDPRSSAVWVIVSFTVPIAGPWFYWAFGINRVHRRAIKRLAGRDGPSAPADAAAIAADSHNHEAVAHLTGLLTVGDRVTQLPLLSGNAIVPLHNGEQAYPEMLTAIRTAKRSLALASYIFDWDDVGRDFALALSDAARRGVRVHILLDGLGAVKTFSRMGRFLIKSGAAVSAFFPLRFPLGRVRLNLRNHRKILVVDGRTGFTGGMNISQKHLLSRASRDRVEDLHFKITGPVVGELQRVFVEDWYLATNQMLTGESYYPDIESAGPALCRGISSGPDENFGKIHWILQASLAAAQQSVRIVTPYFIPSPSLIASMTIAAMRGVEITLILPSRVNHPYMRWAADAYLWQLLERGIRVFRRPPPFVHTKLLIVDERWLLFGSANLDLRSFRLNFEFNIEAYDPNLAVELSAWLDSLLDDSEQVTLESVDARSFPRRLRDGLIKLFSSYL